jgi:hypothetical protein
MCMASRHRGFGYGYRGPGFRALYRSAINPCLSWLRSWRNQGNDNMCLGDSGGPDFGAGRWSRAVSRLNVVINSYSCEERHGFTGSTPQAGVPGKYVALPGF